VPDSLPPPGSPPPQLRPFAIAAGLVTLAFSVPLLRLLRFSIGDDLYSYIPLMPFVTAYLIWAQPPRSAQPSPPSGLTSGGDALAGSRVLSALFLAAGIATAATAFALARSPALAAPENFLALTTFAWLLCLAGMGCWFLSGPHIRAVAFPFCLLLFMVPIPAHARDWLEGALQHGSATVADWMFVVTGTAFWRTDTVFNLPGITLEVTPECSGIHSTWVLLITSFVAGYLILHQAWRRALLVLAVIPLALLRNGFRVFVIGQLCIHVGPRMIDSPVHHHGGPLFFVLSLVPFFLLLYFLRKTEKKTVKGGGVVASQA